MEAYAVIDASSKSMGVTMGKNDLWIAAAAHVTGFELITTDSDFDHLHPDFLSRALVGSKP
jgi:tRNA(fMet)-specific endonuclease VapC